MHRLVFFDLFVLLLVMLIGRIVLRTHEKVLLLYHLLVLIDLFLEHFDLLSQIFLLNLHRLNMIARSLLNNEVL